MKREWQPEELIECWTLLDRDRRLVANKTGATRLGFALLLKFVELEARFPRATADLPLAAVEYMAAQVEVPPGALDSYQWSGSTIEYHRAQIRAELGFREATVADEQLLSVGSRPRYARSSSARSASVRLCWDAAARSGSSRRRWRACSGSSVRRAHA